MGLSSFLVKTRSSLTLMIALNIMIELFIILITAIAASQVEIQHFSAVMSTINLEIDENIHTAVYCFVPLLDSPAWANSTVKFPIEQLQINI